MYSFPFILIALTSGFFDSATEHLLGHNQYWGFLLAFGCMLASMFIYPKDRSGVLFGVLAMMSAGLIDIGVGDLLEDVSHLWLSVLLVVVIGTLSVLFCTWLIPDEYGFQLLISSTAFTVWPNDGKRRMILPWLHQYIYFLGCAAFDLAVSLVMRHTHWAVSYACGLVSMLVCVYLLPVKPLQLLIYFFATTGFDVAASSMGNLVSPNVWIQLVFGLLTSAWLLFAVFGLAYMIGPHRHRWKQL